MNRASSTAPVRLGVVGCARILPAHLRGIAALQQAGMDPVRITALCARQRADAEMFRRRGEGPEPRPPASSNPNDPLGAPHRYVSDLHPDLVPDVFTDWNEMLAADRVDAVLILAPVALHHRIALDCLAAGKHVLIEKPFAISVRAGHAIAEEARRRGLVAGVAENLRYGLRTRAQHWAIEDGHIGTPQLWVSGGIGGEWSPDRIVAHTAWRHRKLEAGGGPAIDHGVHFMHQVRYLLGDIEQISALTRTMEPVRSDDGIKVDNELEDVFLAHLRFADGAIGTTFSGWGGRGERTGVPAGPVIYGSTGCIQGDQIIGDDGRRTGVTDAFSAGAPRELQDAYFPGGVQDSFALELLDFLGAIGSGAGMETDAAAGVLDLAMAFAVLESAHSGGVPVQVADVLNGSVCGYQADIDRHYGL